MALASGSVEVTGGGSGNYTTSNTQASASETQRAYQESLTTDAEVSQGTEVAREVVGAKMQVAVTLRAAGSIPFRIRNLYAVSDDLGRNFDFNSRAVTERTALLAVDNGSYDSDGDGVGDGTEYRRVATYSGRVVDTNGDGKADGGDHRLSFDALGRQVGITLRTALK